VARAGTGLSEMKTWTWERRWSTSMSSYGNRAGCTLVEVMSGFVVRALRPAVMRSGQRQIAPEMPTLPAAL
jgi:hypothetical protein